MITQAYCRSFATELFTGVHAFGTDVFKLALFRDTGSLAGTFGAQTTNYSEMGADEVSGTGYVATGRALTAIAPALVTDVNVGAASVLDFEDVTWSAATITARGALLYNSSKGGKAVAVFDFGSDKIKVGSDFTVQFPAADAVFAVLRIILG